jgi:Uma2 family endonuclease
MILKPESGYVLEINLLQKEELSDEELYAFCMANQHVRIERNENKQIIIMAPTGGETSNKHSEILFALVYWNKQRKSGRTFDSSGGFLLPDGSMRSPDAAWITAEKWNSLSPEQKEHFLPFAPDFLVEVLSPTDHLQPAQEKMHKWIQNGARLAWLLVPQQQLSYIYRADGTVDKVEGFDKKLSGEDVLPGFEFALSVLL